MKKLSNYKTEAYSFGVDFIVDIVETTDCYEAYLYEKHCSIKDLIFGMPKEQQSKKEFINIVEANLLNDNYINDYKEEFMF